MQITFTQLIFPFEHSLWQIRKVSEGPFFIILFYFFFSFRKAIHASEARCERSAHAPLRCHSHSDQERSENKSHCSYSNIFIWHDTGMSWICPLLIPPTHTHTDTNASLQTFCQLVCLLIFSDFVYWSSSQILQDNPWHELNLKESSEESLE